MPVSSLINMPGVQPISWYATSLKYFIYNFSIVAVQGALFVCVKGKIDWQADGTNMEQH